MECGWVCACSYHSLCPGSTICLHPAKLKICHHVRIFSAIPQTTHNFPFTIDIFSRLYTKEIYIFKPSPLPQPPHFFPNVMGGTPFKSTPRHHHLTWPTWLIRCRGGFPVLDPNRFLGLPFGQIVCACVCVVEWMFDNARFPSTLKVSSPYRRSACRGAKIPRCVYKMIDLRCSK